MPFPLFHFAAKLHADEPRDALNPTAADLVYCRASGGSLRSREYGH